MLEKIGDSYSSRIWADVGDTGNHDPIHLVRSKNLPGTLWDRMMRLGSCGPRENGTLEETERFYVVSSWIIIIMIIIIIIIIIIDDGYHPCFMFTHQ